MEIKDLKTSIYRAESIGARENPIFQRTARDMSTRTVAVVQIFTDEGITGISTYANLRAPGPEGGCQIIESRLKPLIIGEDPFNVEKIWWKMHPSRYDLMRDKIGMVDIAIWDIIGKAIKQPLYKVFGGLKNKVTPYASKIYYRKHDDVKILVNTVTEWVDTLGVKAVKLSCAQGTKRDLERLKAAREALGPDIGIAICHTGRTTIRDTIKFCKAVEKYDPLWIEHVTNLWDKLAFDDMAQIRQATTIPIAGDEYRMGPRGWKDLIMAGAVDYFGTIDPYMVGGFTEFRKIAGLAAAHGIPIITHRSAHACVHLLASDPNIQLMESHVFENPLWDELWVKPMTIRNGYYELSNKPGLGIELDEEASKKYLISK